MYSMLRRSELERGESCRRCRRWKHPVWNIAFGTAIEIDTSNEYAVENVAILPDENCSVSTAWREMNVWNMSAESVLSKHSVPEVCVALLPNSTEVPFGHEEGQIVL